jgi:hypothetical protein
MEYRNEYDFDYMNNYKALLACILSKISVDKAIKYITLDRPKKQK